MCDSPPALLFFSHLQQTLFFFSFTILELRCMALRSYVEIDILMVWAASVCRFLLKLRKLNGNIQHIHLFMSFCLSVISDKQVKGGLLLLNKWMMGDVVAKRYIQIENLGG